MKKWLSVLAFALLFSITAMPTTVPNQNGQANNAVVLVEPDW
ncbi:hypothetical protein [Brevibacillus humidisoli]|nr:hypothetical protein [Brevibacillus humidisoli]